LFPWILNLYSSTLNYKITSRIWDQFLLDGEVFSIKLGLALLKYFELELKMSTFVEASKFLKKIPVHINEDYLFSLVDHYNVII
jgi:hypothetical protein